MGERVLLTLDDAVEQHRDREIDVVGAHVVAQVHACLVRRDRARVRVRVRVRATVKDRVRVGVRVRARVTVAQVHACRGLGLAP